MKKYYVFLPLALALFGAALLFFEKKDVDVNYDKNRESYDFNEEELRSRIGQMLIVGFRGAEISSSSGITNAIKDLNLGGVILFDYDVPSRGEEERNIVTPAQTKKLISDLKKVSPSLFVAVDAEGGLINRLKEKYGFVNIPSAQKMGEGSLEETKEQALFLGGQLRELGFNVNFAPVVDVNVNPDNPIIGKLGRSFSGDHEKVTEHALQFMAGLNENGIIAVVKHFPGHGSSQEDSHLGMTDVTNTYQQEEILPYKELVREGYNDMIMTAHVINKNIDTDYPATLSVKFLQETLRKDIGFQGVIISDDMQMGAITEHYGFEEAIIRAVNAGCDMLIISNNGASYSEDDYNKAADAIFNAVLKGDISAKRIDDSYNRIKDLKERYKIITF